MAASLDQLFVNLLHGLTAPIPESIRPLSALVISLGAILAVFGLCFGITTVCERKAIARMQNRLGPNRVGPYGFLQFAADGIKSLTKEDIVPRTADRVVHFLAPLALLVPVVLTFLVLPFGRNMVAMDVDVGLLFFFAAGASTELAVFMAGGRAATSTRLLGAMRAIAQMLSYELPFILSTIGVVMVTGTRCRRRIVEAQAARPGEWLARWNVFTPWGMAAFLLFLIAAFAESNRSPFDSARGGIRDRGGVFHRVFGIQVRAFLHGRVPRHVLQQRHGGDAVPGGLDSPVRVPGLGAVVAVVFR
jgi:NADH-quinone oxidoreductase subunit H